MIKDNQKLLNKIHLLLDALDIVTNENDFNKNNVRMTNVEYSFNGAFRGTGEGRVI